MIDLELTSLCRWRLKYANEIAVSGSFSVVRVYNIIIHAFILLWRVSTCFEQVFPYIIFQSPWIDMFVEVANERPYLWALYAVAIVSPFVLIAACCVKSKVERKTSARLKSILPLPSSLSPYQPKPKDEAAERKKTDAPSPDDPVPPEKESSDGTEEEKSFIAAADDDEVYMTLLWFNTSDAVCCCVVVIVVVLMSHCVRS